jgi:hypothetical protein
MSRGGFPSFDLSSFLSGRLFAIESIEKNRIDAVFPLVMNGHRELEVLQDFVLSYEEQRAAFMI